MEMPASLKMLLVVISLCGICSLALLAAGVCEDEKTRTWGMEECPKPPEWCLKFISTRIVECKYSTIPRGLIVVTLYWTCVSLIILILFTASITNMTTYTLPVASVVSIVGISLVFCVDNVSLSGQYGDVYFEHTPGRLNSAWHGYGVVLFFVANTFMTAAVLVQSYTITSNYNLSRDYDPNKPWHKPGNLWFGGVMLPMENVLALTFGAFIVCYMLNLSFAVPFEYGAVFFLWAVVMLGVINVYKCLPPEDI